MTKTIVAEKARQELQGVEVSGITLRVEDEDVYKVDEWWRVPVRPSRWPRRMSDFYEDLAIVEDDVQKREHLNILLATGLPLEEDEEAIAA